MTVRPGATVRVVLADDQPMLRHSLAIVIDAETDLEVVGQADTGPGAVELATTLGPHVVVMDVRMPGGGIEATRAIVASGSLTRVLVLSMFSLDEYVREALRAGATGFLLKDAHPQRLVDAVRRTASGESEFAPSVLARVVEGYLERPRTRAAPQIERLTIRECEVLTLVGSGLSNHEIAAALTIAVKTVKSHVGRLLTKLGARDRAQLVVAAYDHQLVLPLAGRRDRADH